MAMLRSQTKKGADDGLQLFKPSSELSI